LFLPAEVTTTLSVQISREFSAFTLAITAIPITDIHFFNLIYFKIRYLTAIIFDETRITIRATHTKKY
jgi:hypothetical protein